VTLPAGPAGIPVPAACLVVLDGWGLAPPGPGNAIALAHTPVFDELWAGYPHGRLRADGPHVGLPAGQMGNSEVGHLNLGAGAIVPQALSVIDEAVRDGTLAANPVLGQAMDAAERVHLIGLASDGGVHSGEAHLRGLIELAAQRRVPDLVVHAFTDGRDTLPTAGADFLEGLERFCAATGAGRVASVVGRYWAMDRDRRWDRIQRAYDLLVHGRADHRAERAADALRAAYQRGDTDEFVTPTAVGEEGTIRPHDSVIAFNFRGAEPVRRYVALTEYEEGWPYPVAFPPERPQATISGVIAAAGLRQLHVAETEKYPHVTYFFNGGKEEPVAGEDRRLVPSPRDVPTYDRKPEMSARQAAEAFVDGWREDRPSFGIVNFANPDMVGHTGVIPAAIAAVETVDSCLGEVIGVVHESGGACLICADHGNADNMLEPDGGPNTAHSLNPVPVIVTSSGVRLRREGILADVAPTLLALLGLSPAPGMSGRSLLAG
jgi:2,3-bisphosphoglycerate-independent phosphoglycerate mutase